MTVAPPVTLAEFLRARLDEDEQDAPREGCPGHSPMIVCGRCPVSPRVLADCEAKRRIVDLHAPRLIRVVGGCEHEPGTPVYDCAMCLSSRSGVDGVCDTLMALAQPYASHPSYRSEWAP